MIHAEFTSPCRVIARREENNKRALEKRRMRDQMILRDMVPASAFGQAIVIFTPIRIPKSTVPGSGFKCCARPAKPPHLTLEIRQYLAIWLGLHLMRQAGKNCLAFSAVYVLILEGKRSYTKVPQVSLGYLCMSVSWTVSLRRMPHSKRDFFCYSPVTFQFYSNLHSSNV